MITSLCKQIRKETSPQSIEGWFLFIFVNNILSFSKSPMCKVQRNCSH